MMRLQRDKMYILRYNDKRIIARCVFTDARRGDRLVAGFLSFGPDGSTRTETVYETRDDGSWYMGCMVVEEYSPPLRCRLVLYSGPFGRDLLSALEGTAAYSDAAWPKAIRKLNYTIISDSIVEVPKE